MIRVVKEKEKKEDYSIAKYSFNGKVFEILVDCEEAMKLKRGENVDISSVLKVYKVFKNSRTGDEVSQKDLLDVFKTDDVFEVAKQIIKKGEVELTKEYRDKVLEQKKKAIINKISKESVDPRTGLPHPPKRIELAMEQAGVKIDFYKSINEQIKDVVDKIRPIIPISFDKIKYEVGIPANYVGVGYAILSKYGKIIKSNWLSNGSFHGTVEINAGSNASFLDEISKSTNGTVYLKRLEG